MTTKSTNPKMTNLIAQLHNRTNEAKEAFDQALAEIERRRIENEQQHQEQMKQLKEERRKLDEEKTKIEKLMASASSIVSLNVGGEKITTSRSTLTVAEGTLLARMFSGKWDDKLVKDEKGCTFLDYDPTLFKFLLNQLRSWSDPNIKRILYLPVGSEESFLKFIHSLEFDERFTDEESNTLFAQTIGKRSMGSDYLQTATSSSMQLTDKGRRCEKTKSDGWQCAYGANKYLTGVHRIRFKLEKGMRNILIGICSQKKLPTGPQYYNQPTTHGWFLHGFMIKNGQGSRPQWHSVSENDILELTINCNEQSLIIQNMMNKAQSNMKVNLNDAPFPWSILVILDRITSRMTLV